MLQTPHYQTLSKVNQANQAWSVNVLYCIY